MNKLKGNQQAIQRALKASPGDKAVYINLDLINELPDQYEAVVSQIVFDPKKLEKNFSDVGNGTFMPTPETMYNIAEARGISGGDNSIVAPIYEEVDLGFMNLEKVPSFYKMLVGYRCTKFSTVMEEDGSVRRSSPCTIDYNVFNRCSELWAKEEVTTEGYSVLKEGEYKVKEYGNYVTKNGFYYKKPFTKNGKTTYYDAEPKYNTRYKRRAHFQAELKFAQQKAETKAHEKTIRELAGLMTGYKKEDLASGCLIFAKIKKSKEALKMEQAAELTRISQGLNKQDPAAKMLFGEEPVNVDPLFGEPVKDDVIEQEVEKDPFEAEKLTPVQEAIKIITFYINNSGLISDPTLSAAFPQMKEFLESKPTVNEDQPGNWNKILKNIKDVEGTVPEEMREKHTLY